MDTVELVKKARAGDKDALLALIMVRKLDYYRLAYTYTGNQDEAMDALEDMTLVLFDQIKSLKKPESFYSWSQTILVNICRRQLRNRKKYQSIEDIPAESLSLDLDDTQILQQITLEKYLSRLPVKQQEVLRLRYYLDYDYQSIADLLEIPLGTVKSRISTGLKQLAAHLGGDEFA